MKLEAAFRVIYILKEKKKTQKVIRKRTKCKCSFITLFKIIKWAAFDLIWIDSKKKLIYCYLMLHWVTCGSLPVFATDISLQQNNRQVTHAMKYAFHQETVFNILKILASIYAWN